jgi:hypothetical protein
VRLLLLLMLMGPPGCGSGQVSSGEDATRIIAVAEADVPPDMAQTDATPDPRFVAVMAWAAEQQLHLRPLGQVMQDLGTRFLQTPYVAGMLDAPAEETLIARFDGFDCVLLVETLLAMAQGVVAEDYTWETYLHNLETLRYRAGTLNGYCSRLHYFSEWILENEQHGRVQNLTQELGGIRLEKTLNFMSTHRSSYPRFATNDSLFAGIQAMEAQLAGVELYYLPEGRIQQVYDRLQAGDIIATATDIAGLDVTHTGLVFDNGDGTRGFLHASTTGGVKVSPDLQAYLEGNKVQIGIIVARPVDRR